MCLFLEIGKKCNLMGGGGGGGGIFPYHSEHFPHAENPELLFCSTAFVDKIIRGNMIYNLFYQLVVMLIWRNISLKREMFAKITGVLLRSLFSRTFPFFGKYFPY